MYAAFFNSTPGADRPSMIDTVYAEGRRQQLAELTEMHPTIITPENFEAEVESLQDLEVIFSTWGMPPLTPEQIDRLPKLRAVLYAAGTVKGFAQPFLERGILIASAAAANGIPVAEFCLAQILLSCKRTFADMARNRTAVPERLNAPGVYGETVALIGAGVIAQHLVKLLKPFNLRVMAVCPFLAKDPTKAEALGFDGVISMEEAFAQAYVVSNHLPNLDSLRRVIGEEQFASMREGATFINTGRGAQVDEEALARVFADRSDLTALLDVTDPEPAPEDSPLRRLPNVFITTHIAGSLGNEVVRMADTMIDEFKRFQAGEPLKYGVTLEQLETMA